MEECQPSKLKVTGSTPVGNTLKQALMTTEQLKNYDFILLLDKSSSMSTRDCKGGKSRWEAAQETTLGLARKCAEFDDDGITVIPFAGKFKEYVNIKDSEEQIKRIFMENEPSGSTDTAAVMKYVLEGYTKHRSKAKPIIVICVTDGTPDDGPALARVIVDATRLIEKDEEIGITFLQVGRDASARDFLKSLDDDLVKQGAKFDIVDTKTMDEIEDIPLAEVLIAALTD
jgi:Mg-chelatase subunit ChlD